MISVVNGVVFAYGCTAFIRTKSYFGPDRRRSVSSNYVGPERRKGGRADVIRQTALIDKSKTAG